MKVSRHTLVVAVLAVLVLVAVGLSWPDAPEPLPVPRDAARAAAAPAREPATAPQAYTVPPLLAPAETLVGLPEDEGEHGEFTTATDILKQKLFKAEPKLAQFDYFREHVLLDSATREDYRKLLADKAMRAQTRDELLHPRDAKVSMQTQVKRLMQIDYLREAMAWGEHPDRPEVLSDVERIILEDSFSASMAPDVKRALAASTMELFELLSEQDPARAQALVERARGTRLEKMLEYFADRNRRRLAKERELSLQARTAASTP